MRLFGLAFASILLLAVTATARQTPPRLPATPALSPPIPVDSVLDGYLQRWEQEMQKVQSLEAQMHRLDVDHTFNAKTEYEGVARYMKDGKGPSTRNLALLEMRPKGQKDFSEKFICTGTYLYMFSPGTKEIKAYELPKTRPGEMADDNFLSFMFGMKAEEAKRRYDLKLDHQDDYYIYVNVTPRYPRDREDFQTARIVLYKKTFLPTQLYFRQPNNNEVQWDISPSNLRINIPLNQRAFEKPVTPKDWKFVQVPLGADAPPKIYRNSGTP